MSVHRAHCNRNPGNASGHQLDDASILKCEGPVLCGDQPSLVPRCWKSATVGEQLSDLKQATPIYALGIRAITRMQSFVLYTVHQTLAVYTAIDTDLASTTLKRWHGKPNATSSDF